MASLIPAAGSTGSGSMTLQGPSTSSTQTVTIPDATGTMMVSGNMPAFSAYLSSTQSISNSVFTKVQCNTKEFDTANCYDNTTNYRFTPNVAGYYQVTGNIYFYSSSGNVTVVVGIYKNGTGFKYGNYSYPAAAPATTITNASALIYMNGTTDYLELYGYLTAVSLPSFYGSQTQTYFQAAMVRAA